MGKKDVEEKRFMEIPENFADLCNGVLFGGEQVIRAEDLEDSPTEVTKETSSVMSDVAKRWILNNTVISVIEVENQSQTDYAMVIRNVGFIAARYTDQLRKKRDAIEKLCTSDVIALNPSAERKPDKEERLSGMLKDSLFTPVIVIVVNYNEEKWKGKRNLLDMLDLRGFPKEIRKYLLNYKMVLFDYHKLRNYGIFHGEMKTVCEILSLQKKRTQLDEYLSGKEICGRTARLLGSVMNVKNLDKYTRINENGEEVTNMCTAIREMVAEGRAEGRAEGILYTRIETIKNLMDSMKLTLIEAMDTLQIPKGERDEIKKHMK